MRPVPGLGFRRIAAVVAVVAAWPCAGAPAPRGEIASASEAAEAARALLPSTFQEYQTGRFLVLSDTQPRWTRDQARHLERAHHQFLRFCRCLGLEPEPIRHKLVAVCFDRREAYRDFALEHDQVADPSLAGYYAPRPDRVVFYNIESNPSLTEARDRLEAMQSDIRALESRVREAERQGAHGQASRLRELRGEYRRHLARQRDRVEAFASQAATATIVHEAVHQLLFHTGVQSRSVEYPMWISEGLATAFETEDPGTAFGPDHEYAPRRARFEALLATDGILPIRLLVTALPGEAISPQLMDAVYHQGYALVTWMHRFRRTEFRRYLELLRRERAGRPSPERHLEIFEEAFGDASELERAWLRHEKS